MSPFSGHVLGGAAVLSAPALWNSLVLGTTPVAEGLLRYIGAVVVCWLGLALLVAMVGPAPRSTVDPPSTTNARPVPSRDSQAGEPS